MSLTVSTSSQVNDLAEAFTKKLAGGEGGREVIADHALAFGWAVGGPSILAGYTASSPIDGLSFTACRVAATGTPATEVPEGGPKPTATTTSTFEVRLAKYSGLSIFTTEQALTTIALLPALTSALFHQALVAYDTDAVAALAADHGDDVTGATWSSAILAAVASVIGAGGNPDLLVMSGSDYAAAIESPGSGYVLSAADAVPSLFGLRIAVCVGAVAGTAYVLDSKAVVSVEHNLTPAVLLDVYSLSDTNRARIVADVWAATVVCNPGSVAAVTVTAGGATRGGGSGRRGDYALGA